jgi:eukaryotic-like serine/threonine-protein kinase
LLDRSGKTLSTIGDRGDYSDIELSRDGTRAAVSVRDPNTNMRALWLVDLDRGLSSRLTFTPSNGMRSAWSPDGSKLVFSRDQNRMDIFITSVTGGTSSEQPLLANDDFNRSLERVPLSWSPDGSILLEIGGRFSLGIARTGGVRTPTELWSVRVGDHTPVPFLKMPFTVSQGRFSPDGRWVAFTSEEITGQPEVFIAPFPGSGDRKRVSTQGGALPRWGKDGKELFFVHTGQLWSVDTRPGPNFINVGTPHQLFPIAIQNSPYISPYDVLPNGQRFFVNLLKAGTQGTASSIAVVLNWAAGLP